jgi:amino acid adenylation domain-containing protein
MENLTAFPCQSGHTDSQSTEQWSSHDVTVQLDTNVQISRDHKNITDCVRVAYANTIQAHTGDTAVRFLSVSLDEPSHWTHTFTKTPQTTVADAAKEISKSAQCCADASPTATNALVNVSPCIPTSFSKPVYKIPLQMFYQIDTGNSLVRIRLFFDQALIDAFHADNVARYLSTQIKVILEARSDARIDGFDALTREDIAYIKKLNSQAQTIDSRTIHECISSTAALGPSKIAIEAWDGILTREQLEQESEKLAIILVNAGVERGNVVGIVMEKSVWTPVAMVAIMKAGAAFLLLEPTLPFERLKIMTQTARTQHMVTSRKDVDLVCSLVPTVISNDGCGDFTLVDNSDDRKFTSRSLQLPKVDPIDQAFYIFTSGSSGIPKAVITQHFAWVTGYTQHVHKFGISEGTRVFQYVSYSFVVSILDTLSTLLVGGTVCIPGPDERLNDLERSFCRLRAEYVCMTPSVAQTLAPTKIPSIQTLVLGGEPMSRSLVNTWTSTGKVTLRNGYGQSEACSMNSTAVLSSPDASQRNIGNSTWVRYWIVDPWNHDRLMPIGGLGELLIEGYSVAQGYLDQPEKTAAAFIERPSWAADFGAGEEGRRWYKTGDLVQYQANGDLFLYGRKDAQLKVHGQRVEAAEIEYHVLKALHGEIAQVVVDKISPVDQPDDGKLVAFVTRLERSDSPLCDVESQPRRALEKDLRDLVCARLQKDVPMWMIPSAIIVVSKMPRTATGKLDRRALKESYRAESHPLEEEEHSTTAKPDMKEEAACERLGEIAQANLAVLKNLWSRILKVKEDALTSKSNWINAGGDSLSAMILVRDARNLGFSFKSLDVMSGMPLIDMCQCRHDSIDALKTSQSTVEPEEPISSRLYSTTDFQREYLSRTTALSKDLLYKYVFTFRGHFAAQRLRAALETWIKNTEALRLTFSYSDDGNMFQRVISPDDEDEWRFRLQDDNTNEQFASKSSDWDYLKHPVLISILTNHAVNSESIEMGIHIHHSIFDGSSFNLLLEDLVATYLGNQVPTRPSFVTYLNRRTQPPDSSEYWSQLLQGSTPTVLRTNPGSDISSPNTSPPNDPTIKRSLHLPPNPHKASMSTLVQTAWSLVLSALSQRSDVLFLYLMHGRDEQTPHSEAVIGCCVTECPLRVRLENDEMSCSELTAQIQTQVLHSAPHAHLGSATIAANCTAWPSDTHLGQSLYQHSSYVQHQTVAMHEHLPVSDIGYVDVSEPDVEHKLRYDFDLLTTSTGPRELCLQLRSPGEVYSAVEAEAVAEAFALALRMLIAEEGSVGCLRERVRGVVGLPVIELVG